MAHSGNDFENSSLFMSREQLEDELKIQQKTVGGLFTDGKLHDKDEGMLCVAVGREKDAVVIRFPKPATWIGFTADQAMEIANDLIKHARKIGLKKLHTIDI